MTIDFKVGDWVTCDELDGKYHVIDIDGTRITTDEGRDIDDTNSRIVEYIWNHDPGSGWEFHAVVEEEVKPKPDSLDVKLFSVHRSATSKGYEIALFPGAPFGPEVVLSLRERGELEVEVAVETPEDKPEFVSVVMGAVTVLMDRHTAELISSALYQHGLNEVAATGEEVQS